MAQQTIQTEVCVLGAGPGGYTAAFRASDLGKKVVLIERFEKLGGVCLNVGCIPSKALLHMAKVLDEAHDLKSQGIAFGKPDIDLKQIRTWKNSVIQKLTTGLNMLAKKRKVERVVGAGKLINQNQIAVETQDGLQTIEFEQAIIAAGSAPAMLPFLPEDPRIMDSTGALDLADIPETLLIIGGGVIGMEMACVYQSLGSEVTVVEVMPDLLAGADPDLVKPFLKRVQKKFKQIFLNTKVTQVESKEDGLWVSFEGAKAPKDPMRFDKILCAVGRTPNTQDLNLSSAGIEVDSKGFIVTDQQMRTSCDHIFAIGDIVGHPMLAHKAIPEGKIAAEVISGAKHYFDPKCIPSVAYTDPEVAWVGVTEAQAQAENKTYEKGLFPWAASGRALAMGRSEGLTKVLFDEHKRVIGAGIVGPNAGDLIAEIALAIEMGADAQDLALTVHPHPTISETIAQAAEAFEGTITDL